MKIPKIRNNEAFVQETSGMDLITNELILQWDNEQHSISKHLMLMYSIAKGVGAKCIAEVGFGRSSKVLARVAAETEGRFYCCDRQDYAYLFSEKERQTLQFINGLSSDLWKQLDERNEKLDFAFLDHFSGKGITIRFCFKEFWDCARFVKKDGYICVHDVADQRYPVRKLTRLVELTGCFDVVNFSFNQGLLVARKRGTGPSLLGCGVLGYFACKNRLRSILVRFKKS